MRCAMSGGADAACHNELYLQVFDLEGELLEDRLVVENHAMMMYTPFLEDNAPDGGGKRRKNNGNPSI